MTNRRVLSGIRSSGSLHLGNYLGALRNWQALQHQYECYYFIADWHALTTDYQSPQGIRQSAIEMVMDWLGVGLDPNRSVLFRQSRVKEHAELHLILSMITPVPWLERNPTYKDQIKELAEKDLSTYGFLGYPVLQAADIIQPDITHYGGIMATKKLAAWADAYYVLVAPHNVGGPVATAAALHLAACTPNFKIQEHFNDFADAWVQNAAAGLPPVDASDGCFALPSGPGLGVTIDEAFLAEHPREQVFFNLFEEGWQRRQARRE